MRCFPSMRWCFPWDEMDLETIHRNYFFSKKSLEQNPSFFLRGGGRGNYLNVMKTIPLSKKNLNLRKERKLFLVQLSYIYLYCPRSDCQRWGAETSVPGSLAWRFSQAVAGLNSPVTAWVSNWASLTLPWGLHWLDGWLAWLGHVTVVTYLQSLDYQ